LHLEHPEATDIIPVFFCVTQDDGDQCVALAIQSNVTAIKGALSSAG